MNVGTMLITLAGGLGLFLYGMSVMSDAIEKVAGAKLRSILEFFTKNKIMGMIVGIIFTGIVQSSSACTVMVVSFVNSGLMNLYQAAGVIFGANIGTTVTSQLVSFNLSEYAPLFLLLGVIAVLFGGKNPKVAKVGEIIVGFGILFMGLSNMSSAMSDMREMPQVIDLLGSLKSPILALLVGFVLTFIIQSSSVTVSIVLLMANQGLLDIHICLFIILGCNIGSCGSALIASLAGKKDAKRAALIHLLFNIIGSIIIYIILQFAMEPIVHMIQSVSADNGRFVANAHTLIKVFQVIILLPFSNLIVKLTYLIVPGKEVKAGYRDSFSLNFIGDTAVYNPATAVFDAMKEIERMGELAEENLTRSMNALITLDEETIKEVYDVEENINFLNHAITDYLVKVNQSTLPIKDLEGFGYLFHVVNDIERIGDHAENIADCAVKRKESSIKFSKEAQKELGDMLEMVTKIVRNSIETFHHKEDEHVRMINELENTIDEKERELQQKHIERLTQNACTPEAGMIFSDVVSGLERVADHATNITHSIANIEE
ncbi:MAG: Na/Pi cotransporter family protein [Lachnospiraceae bacterium]|nr:Na/Pi cotransporter family protein [Lachnospiraceae bacterium]